MASITVRRFEERDRAGFGKVRSMTFRGGRPVLDTEDLLGSGRRGYVAEREGEIAGAMTVLDMDCTRDGSAVSNAGVCAVGVLPDKRKGGVGSNLLREGVKLFREDGYVVTSLFAYREPFYRQFGYEVCGSLYTVKCPVPRLPFGESLPIRQIASDDFDHLRDCFKSFASRYSGMHTRSDDSWWRLNGGEHPYVAYVYGDPIEAYIIVRLEGEFWVTQDVREFVWTTRRGYDALLSLLAGIGINKSHVQWPEPGGSPLMLEMIDQGIEYTLRRPISYRILDVPKALSILKPYETGTLILAVRDPILAENHRNWLIDFSPEGVSVNPTDEYPDMEMEIKPLTQAWLGDPSFDDVLREGLVRVLNPTKLNTARALFRPARVYCADTF